MASQMPCCQSSSSSECCDALVVCASSTQCVSSFTASMHSKLSSVPFYDSYEGPLPSVLLFLLPPTPSRKASRSSNRQTLPVSGYLTSFLCFCSQSPLLPSRFPAPRHHYNYRLCFRFCIRWNRWLPRFSDIYSHSA
jgi:hypothetical protein